MSGENRFYVADFVVFSVTVVISLGIGVYYALSGGRQRTTSEYLLGGRLINYIPVAISLMVSFESSIMMLGLPAEGYFYGIQLVISIIGSTLVNLLAVHIVVPLIHPLKITSAYEYLEYRFKSKSVRLLGATMGILTYVWYMGIVLFGPAIALEAVTGFPLWASILIISMVSVLYTSLGGLKAVVWADVFQAIVMFSGIFAILIKGTLAVGGAKQVWNTAMTGGRLQFFNFDPNPMVRHTFWGLTIGTMFRQLAFCFNQSTVQRISSINKINQAKRILWIVAPCFAFNTFVGTYEGIVAYAYYETKGCDPYKSDKITNPNQLMPYMVMDIFRELPGMPGLFLASLFSASLSTLSSGLSSLSAILWTDIIHPMVGEISDFKGALVAKLSVLLFGCIACGLAFLVSSIGGIIHQIATIILAAFSSPVSGLFLLGCFSPRVTAKGALVGGLAGLFISCWISFGMNFSPSVQPTPMLPSASMGQCFVEDVLSSNSTRYHINSVTYSQDSQQFTHGLVENITTSSQGSPGHSDSSQPENQSLQGLDILYNLSYLWLPVISLGSTMIIGYVFSLITGPNKPGDVDPRYLINFSSSVFHFCPSRFQKWLSSCGTQFINADYKKTYPELALNEKLIEDGAEKVVSTSTSTHPDMTHQPDIYVPNHDGKTTSVIMHNSHQNV